MEGPSMQPRLGVWPEKYQCAVCMCTCMDQRNVFVVPFMGSVDYCNQFSSPQWIRVCPRVAGWGRVQQQVYASQPARVSSVLLQQTSYTVWAQLPGMINFLKLELACIVRTLQVTLGDDTPAHFLQFKILQWDGRGCSLPRSTVMCNQQCRQVCGPGSNYPR